MNDGTHTRSIRPTPPTDRARTPALAGSGGEACHPAGEFGAEAHRPDEARTDIETFAPPVDARTTPLVRAARGLSPDGPDAAAAASGWSTHHA
ncbi:hypothetical protein [Kitasatospora sp. NBC_00458]|uniref:hypothetical protein n=1 Tax=Kitasatospora sp. NBC_00458 TaxID=2903568 RepID=UPI002E198B1B